MKFDIQLLIEPLKELLFNRPSASLAGALSDKIRFFIGFMTPLVTAITLTIQSLSVFSLAS